MFLPWPYLLDFVLAFDSSSYFPVQLFAQVIRNSNGCNLAVDIWSLGCTVLEMATTKPPWSQFEGVSNLIILIL